MPQILKDGAYSVYFWSNESYPLEPVHVHVAKGQATANGTKVWITRDREALLCNNNGNIPNSTLRDLLWVIQDKADLIIQKWLDFFGQIDYYR